MSSVNVQVSVSNLVQMDKHQSDIHRGPAVNQEQNADIAKNESAQRITKPVEPDHTEGKTVKPGDRRKEDPQKGKKRKSDDKKKPPEHVKNRGENGYFVDLQA